MPKKILLALALLGAFAAGDALAAQRRRLPVDPSPWPFAVEAEIPSRAPDYGSMCDYPRLLRFYGDDITARLACHGLLFY